MRAKPRPSKVLRYWTLGLAGVLLLIILACGDDATPQPTATPVDVGAISSAVQESVVAAVREELKAAPDPLSQEDIRSTVREELRAVPEPVSQEEIRRLVEAAVTAAVPEGTSPDEIRSLVRSAVEASVTHGVTRDEVAELVTGAVTEATAGGPRPLSALEVGLIVEKALKALPTVTPVPTATPAPIPTPQPTATPLPTPTPTVAAMARGVQCCNVPLQSSFSVPHWNMYEGHAIHSLFGGPLYNGIVEYNPETDDQTDIRGDLATDWELSDDGLTYTFHINESARWMDGRGVSAEDVAFSLDSMVDTDAVRLRVSLIRPFYKESRVVDGRTVEIETKFPAAPFLAYLAADYFKIWPKHHVETKTDEEMRLEENILGSGPFRLVSHDKDIVAEYTRNPDYFKEGRPYWDGMRYFIITDPGRVFAAFKARQVLTHAFPTNQLSGAENERLAQEMEGKGKVFYAGPIAVLFFNINTSREPFTDARVRHALHLATHRQPFIETFSSGRDSLGGPFPNGVWFSQTEEELAKLPGYRETADGQKHPDDIAEAKRLLVEAGQEGFESVMIARTIAEFVPMAQIFTDQMRTFLGVDLTIDALDAATGGARRAAGDYFMDATGFGQVIAEPHDFIAGMYVKDAFTNFGRWTDPRIEDLFVQQQKELDRTKRKAMIAEIARIILEEDTPHILINWTVRGMYVDDRINNFHPPISLNDQMKMEHLWCAPRC